MQRIDSWFKPSQSSDSKSDTGRGETHHLNDTFTLDTEEHSDTVDPEHLFVDVDNAAQSTVQPDDQIVHVEDAAQSAVQPSDHIVAHVEEAAQPFEQPGTSDYEAKPTTKTKDTFTLLSDKTEPYPSDPKLYVDKRMSPELVRAMLQMKVCQPGLKSEFEFPRNDQGRHFRKQWYYCQIKNNTTRYRDWLVYSPRGDCAFCSACWLFANRSGPHYDPTFSDPRIGFKNWKKAIEKLQNHEHSGVHNMSITELLKTRYRLKTGITVSEQQVSAFNKDVENNREILMRLLDITLFLAKQNLPFRGHKESSHSSFEQCDGDTNDDVSGMDQLSFCLRYVDRHYTIQERFLKFIDVESSKSAELFNTQNSLLEEHGLDIEKIRCQGYDGASNMSGATSGLQARVKEKNELAYYIHCCGHVLNLVLADTCSEIPEVIIFFATIEKIYTFFTKSHPRYVVFQKEQERLKLTTLKLQRICETRWHCKHSAVKSVLYNYPVLLTALEKIIEEHKDPTSVAEANGLMDQISKLEFILLLSIWEDIIGSTFALSNYLQSTSIDITTGSTMIKSTSTELTNKRTTENFQSILELPKAKAEKENVNTEFQQVRTRRRKVRPGELAQDETINRSDERFKINVFFAIFDNLLGQMSNRFNDFLLYASHFTCLLPNHLESYDSFNKLANMYAKDVDVDIAASEYKQYSAFMKEIDAQNLLSDSTIQEILHFIKKQRLDNAYPNVSILYRILGTLTVSSATAERSFSKLKIIKSYLRSTMGEERLSGLAIISIERDLATSVSFKNVIDTFSSIKKRKWRF
ncbi:Zinc finger MYM-type protein 1 [Holothuria leucospilota]|uniref:Zinc finger MYM-type protein 1 n=1 Tax=Holothuria leucospilota TaxID=206669 RepID=A0A9Q1CGE2_HOLLE|nr:Zinc finger MYM-type protein 1 [Holothuria leucospilota]